MRLWPLLAGAGWGPVTAHHDWPATQVGPPPDLYGCEKRVHVHVQDPPTELANRGGHNPRLPDPECLIRSASNAGLLNASAATPRAEQH
jgi:hypothetical protein